VSGEPPRSRVRGPHLFVSNWVWAVIVLCLIGVVVWGWAFDFAT